MLSTILLSPIIPPPPLLSSYVDRSRHEGPALGTDVPAAAARPDVIVVGQIHVKHEFTLHRQKRLTSAWRWRGGCLSRLLRQFAILPLLHERNRPQNLLKPVSTLACVRCPSSGVDVVHWAYIDLGGAAALDGLLEGPQVLGGRAGPRWHCFSTSSDMHKLAQSAS